MQVVQSLLQRVPALTLLITSRQLLGLSAEREYVLAPLPTPHGENGGPEQLSAYDSVRLFIDRAQQAGQPYSQIWHLFAYKPEATKHLERFTQAVLRGPSPLSPGLRELIAAYTSKRNECEF